MTSSSVGVVVSWRPLLSGTTAQRALQAVDAIAESIAYLSPGERDPSLAGGQAGLALLYAWLARARRGPQARQLAGHYLDQAVEIVASDALESSLWHGFTGVAWAAELVDRLVNPTGEDRNEAVDAIVSRFLSRDLWAVPHDLVMGVTGLGVYALERYPRPSAVECLHYVVERLETSARHDDHGIYWWTPPTELNPEDQTEFPSGRADLGVAHGVSGAIALLGAIYAAGVERAKIRPLLAGTVRWLRAQAVMAKGGPTFPYFVAPGLQPKPARSAWCYGDPGIAAALLLAARATGETEWEREAVALACRAAERPTTEAGVEDAGFCHGTAGLAHLYNRMYQTTGEPKLGRASRYWLERTVDFCRLAQDRGGLWVKGTEDPRVGGWTDIDIMTGAAGIALVLLAATIPVEPIWDRMFLVSAPHVSQAHRA